MAGDPAELLFAFAPTPDHINLRFDQAVAAGGRLFMTAHRDREPESLYATGGTDPLFTALTYDSSPGYGIDSLAAFGGKLYFLANAEVDGVRSDGLFCSDGTPAGTREVKVLGAGTAGRLGSSTFQLNGRLYFFWSGPGGGQMWSTDGTSAGTAPVWTAPAGTGPVSEAVSPVVDGHVFFGAAGQLWRTDGTAAGTTSVWTLPPGYDYPATYAVGGQKLYLTTAGSPSTLYAGGRDGSGIVAVPTPAESLPMPFAVGDRALAWTPNSLHSTDGTPGGLAQLAGLPPGTYGYEAGRPVAAGPAAAAFLQNFPYQGTGTGLWVTDGTPAGTRLVAPRSPLDPTEHRLFSAAGRAFMRDPAETGVRLTQVDGPAATARSTLYLAPASDFGGRNDVFLAEFDGRIVLQGNRDGYATLWALDPDAPTGSVAGVGYVDANRNGRRDGFERQLQGTAYVDLNGSGTLDAGDLRAKGADPLSSAYVFDGLTAGSYVVRMQLFGNDAGLVPTVPVAGRHDVQLQPGETRGGLDFAVPGSSTLIWGNVFDDADGDAVRDSGEGGPTGAPPRVYLDLNGNRAYDAAIEPSTLTAGDGSYGFAVTAPGTYTVRRVDQLGWRQTTPAARGGATVTVGAGAVAEAAAIGVQAVDPPTIAGRTWVDADADGVRDPDEVARAGERLQLLDEFGRVSATATTGADGTYSFAGLLADVPYRVRFSPPSGLSLTAADRGADDTVDSDADPQTTLTAPLTLAGGQLAAAVDAGFIPLTVVFGSVYRDTNGDGRREANEPQLNVPVFLDADGDGLAGPGETTVLPTAGSSPVYMLYATPGVQRVGVVVPPGFAVTGTAASRTVTLPTGGGGAKLDIALVAAGAERHLGPAGAEFRLNQTTDGSQTRPAVAADGTGNVLAVWQDLGAQQLVGRRFGPAGEPLGGEFVVSTAAAPAGGPPRVAALAGGTGYVVAWVAGGTVFVRRLAADGTPQGPALQLAQAAGTQPLAAVAADPAGGFAVAWAGATAGDTAGVAFRRFDAAGTPLGAEVRANDVVAGSQTPGALAFDPAGGLAVAYTSDGQDGSSTGVYLRRFAAADAAPLGPAVLVNVTTIGAQVAAGLAVSPAGRTAVLWFYNADVFARTFDADGTPLGGEVRVDSSTAFAFDPTAAALVAGTDGTFLAAWGSQQDGDGFGAYAQLLGPDGTPNGRELRLNTTTAGSQIGPTIATGPGGTYFAAWASGGQDGSSDRVYAQRLVTFADPSAVAGVAWADANGDGVRQAGEAGLGTVAVELYSAAGAIVDSTYTADDGSYRFAAVRPGEGYRVRFVPPAGKIFSPPDQGADDAADADADPATGYAPAFVAAAAGGTVGGGDAGLNAGAAPPAVRAAAVNAGAAQRSAVTGVTVTFDGPVVPASGAFALSGRAGAGAGVTVSAANPSGDGRTWVLSFAGPGVVNGSLPDGVYDLRVVAAEVRATGTGGPTMAADAVVTFHRLFGDQDGNGTVNNADYVRFRAAFGSSAGSPAYNALFDYDGNGVVNNVDYLQFRNRFGATLSY